LSKGIFERNVADYKCPAERRLNCVVMAISFLVILYNKPSTYENLSPPSGRYSIVSRSTLCPTERVWMAGRYMEAKRQERF
jgi:hypothetical protein